MKIVIYHASKFGNGAKVAEELRRIMTDKGHQAEMHHVKEAKPKELPTAELYVFGSPTRLGKPIGNMRRFLKKVKLPAGTRYALFATHGDAIPNKKTGKLPTEEELARWRMTLPIMQEILTGKGMVKVADKIFLVTGDQMKGHLKDGWQGSVEEFAIAILSSSQGGSA